MAAAVRSREMTVDPAGKATHPPDPTARRPNPAGAQRARGGVPTIDEVDQVVLAPIRPAAGWYVLGGALVLGGLAAGIAVLFVGAFGHLRALDELERFAAPGEITVPVDEGRLRIYHEPVSGRSADPVALGLTVRPVGDDPVDGPAGAELVLERPGNPDRYVFEGRRGVEVAAVEVPRPGTYRVTATGAIPGTLAVGPGPERHLATVGLVAVALAAAGAVSGVVVLVVVRNRRRRARAARSVDVRAGVAGSLRSHG
jgi:hypothetical protein